MEAAVLYRLPFDSTCLLFFSIHAYGWHSDTRAMFFLPRCWMQRRRSVFRIPTHIPEYYHLNYIEFQKSTCIFLWKYWACFSIAQTPWWIVWPQFPHGSYDQDMMPFCLLPETFSNQSRFLSFLVLKHHHHLSLHGKKNRLVLSTLLEKTSGNPWRRRSTLLSCSMRHVSKYLCMCMGFINPTVYVPRLLKVKSWFWVELHGTIIGTVICIFINRNKSVYSVYLKSYCVNADTKAGRGTKPQQIYFPLLHFMVRITKCDPL